MKFLHMILLCNVLFFYDASFGMQMPMEYQLPDQMTTREVRSRFDFTPHDITTKISGEYCIKYILQKAIDTGCEPLKTGIRLDGCLDLYATDLLAITSLAKSKMRCLCREYNHQIKEYYVSVIDRLRESIADDNNMNLVIDLSDRLRGKEKVELLHDLHKIITVAPVAFKFRENQLQAYITSMTITPQSFAVDSIENIVLFTYQLANILDDCAGITRVNIDSAAVCLLAKNSIYIAEVDRICKTVVDNASRRAAVIKLRKYANLLRANYSFSASNTAIAAKSVVSGLSVLVPYVLSSVAIVSINRMILKHFPNFYARVFYSAYTAYGTNRVKPAFVFLSCCGLCVARDLLVKKANVVNYQGAIPAPIRALLVFFGNGLRMIDPSLCLLRPLQQINAGQIASLTSAKDTMKGIFGGTVSARTIVAELLLRPIYSTCLMAKFSRNAIGRHVLGMLLVKFSSKAYGANSSFLETLLLYASGSLVQRSLVKCGIGLGVRRVKAV